MAHSGDCGFTAEGVRAIAQANLINMNVVELSTYFIDSASNAIGWEGADAIINAKWPSLTELFVGDCGLDDDSVYRLIQGDWAKLTVLWIGSGCIQLSRQPSWLRKPSSE